MTDLRAILPSFPAATFPSILPALDRHALTTTDILTLHPADIAKQTQLPLLDLKRFIAAVQASLFDDLDATRVPVSLVTATRTTSEAGAVTTQDEDHNGSQDDGQGEAEVEHKGKITSTSAAAAPSLPGLTCISTLDPDLDAALGGGVPVGRITEFAGESGAGKTQFLLSLCLAVQLPPPHGTGKKALYISTESGLATSRLAQMLRTNDILLRTAATKEEGADDDGGGARIGVPSLDNILSPPVLQDLESQDHILQYQVPVLLARHDIGLIVLDSVAANYRAEFERQTSTSSASRGSNMAARSAELVRLGALLRDMARRHSLAIVVANQVADRFSDYIAPPPMTLYRSPATGPRPSPSTTQETPLPSRMTRTAMPPPPSSFTPLPIPSSLPAAPLASSPSPPPMPFTPLPPPDDDDGSRGVPPALLLDHQQRWFTGWGDDPTSSHPAKTPSLGLVWSTQIAVRVALFKRPVYGQQRIRTAVPSPLLGSDYDDGDDSSPMLRSWRRWMKVVFAPHAKASGNGVDGAVEFQITMAGLKAIKPKVKGRGNSHTTQDG